MGDDGRYSVSGVGTVSFQREHGALITLIDVKYVPGLKKNLVSVAMLEEKGYDVVTHHHERGETDRFTSQEPVCS